MVAPQLQGQFGVDRQLTQLTPAKLSATGWGAVAAAATARALTHPKKRSVLSRYGQLAKVAADPANLPGSLLISAGLHRIRPWA